MKDINDVLNTLINAAKDAEKEPIGLIADSAFKIDKKQFKPINDKVSGRKIAFVDGGNAEIVKSSAFSLQFIRVYWTIYDDNKRIKASKKEFYAFVRSADEEGKITYSVESFPARKHLSFDAFDRSISMGNQRADISIVGNIVRRFAELEAAKEAISNLEKGDCIVLDGTLEAHYPGEKELLVSLCNSAQEKGIVVSALSKTTDMITKKGSSVVSILQSIQPDFSWSYPASQLDTAGCPAQIYFVKLNKDSKYIFRFEICNDDNHQEEILASLAKNSKDAVFIGYPYGLIEADKFARVSNEEKEYLRTTLMAKAGKDWKIIEQQMSSANAHDILDHIG